MKDDVLVYTPEANTDDVADSFEYTVTDCRGNSSTATVTLDIQCASTQTSDTGSAMNTITMMLMMILTGTIGLLYVRREELKEGK